MQGMENKQKTIYDLELHELTVVGDLLIYRVHGGFIYCTNNNQSVFVPYEAPLILETKGDIQFLSKSE